MFSNTRKLHKLYKQKSSLLITFHLSFPEETAWGCCYAFHSGRLTESLVHYNKQDSI